MRFNICLQPVCSIVNTAPRGNGFDYNTNWHEINNLLPIPFDVIKLNAKLCHLNGVPVDGVVLLQNKKIINAPIWSQSAPLHLRKSTKIWEFKVAKPCPISTIVT